MGIGNRRLWFRVHGWLSLPVWALFAFVCLTGTVAVVSHEITWLANPAARADNPHGLPAKPLPELVDAVQRAVPGGEIGQIMVLEPYLVTTISVSSPDMPHAIAYVNPYTAVVQAVEQGITFIGFMRELHGWLLFPWEHSYSVGYYLVGTMSLVVLGALVTGLVVYKRFWRAYTRPRVRSDKGSRVLLGDLHRHAGAWSLWFLLIMGLTGFWYLVQAVLWHNETDVWDHPKPAASESVPVTDGAPAEPIGLARALEQARGALPTMEPAWISFPEHSRDYYSIAGRGDVMLFDQYSHRVFVNPWDGTVVEVREPASMNALQTVAHLADPLHYGTFGGLWTKAIWFVFGCLLTSMSLTGFMVWSKRTRSESHSTLPKSGRRASHPKRILEEAR